METLTKKPVNGQEIHIYEVGRLFRQGATRWNSYLKEMEESRDFMLAIYAPLRSAINVEMSRPGLGKRILDRGLKKLEGMKNYDSVATTSKSAFEIFKTQILPTLSSIDEDFVNGSATNSSFIFGDHVVKGGFHARVTTKEGEKLLLYFHPSKWSEDHQTAFIELLTVMAENVFGFDRSQVRFVDIREGLVVKPSKTYKAVRKELESTIKLIARFKTVNAA